MRALVALGAALALQSACSGPSCQSSCTHIYADATGECGIAVPGYDDADGRARLIASCTEDCTNALQTPGAMGTYDPNIRHTSGTSIVLQNEQQAAAWMDCIAGSDCVDLSDGYCAPI